MSYHEIWMASVWGLSVVYTIHSRVYSIKIIRERISSTFIYKKCILYH